VLNSLVLLKILSEYYRVSGRLRRLTGWNRKLYVKDRIDFYRDMWASAAHPLGAELQELDRGFWEISSPQGKTRINLYKTQFDDPVVLDIAGNKPLCHRLLTESGLPVPDHLLFKAGMDRALLYAFVSRHPGYLVIKPASNTAAAQGITTHVHSQGECIRAVARAMVYGGDVLLEGMVPGELYRFLVVNGRVIHVIKRQGVRVCGDGASTITELLKCGHDARVDRDLAVHLQAQNLTGHDIPEKGKVLLVKCQASTLRQNVEELSVYDHDVTDDVCDELKAEAAQAARIIGSQFAGVELITMDSGTSLEKSGGCIIEINTTPGLHHHYDLVNVSDGSGPATEVLRLLLEPTPGEMCHEAKAD